MTPWSAEIEAFLQHWQSLRGAAPMPESERFLDHAPITFMPRCYIVEIKGDVAFVRFQGSAVTEFWQRDFTGRDMHADDRGKYKARSLSNLMNIIGQPCGQYARFHFSTSLGGQLLSEYLNLPLAVKPGRARRVICFVKPEIQNERVEPMTRTIQSCEQQWVDIGAGMPNTPPHSFV